MENIRQKLRRSVLYLLGFSAFPMLTSCYGMPQDYDPGLLFHGNVLSKDLKPIEGIEISYTTIGGGNLFINHSSNDGEYTVYERQGMSQITFSDRDGDANGGDFEQQSKTIKEIKENGNVILELKNEK